MLTIRNLSKSFENFLAVDHISFSAFKGQILGFLGPNGAGKSTTMRMITGALKPDTGQIIICDTDIAQNPVKAKRHFGYLPEGAPLWGDMTAREYLSFIGHARVLSMKEYHSAFEQTIHDAMITEVVDTPIHHLSKGYKRRVGLAGALLGDPEVLILDEPTDGLDPNQKRHIRKLLKRLAKKKTIIVSTHILEEVEAVCTNTIIINKGKIVVSATPRELMTMAPSYNAVIVVIQTKVIDECVVHIENLQSVDKVVVSKRMQHWSKIIIYPKKGKYILVEIADVIHSHEYHIAEIKCDPGKIDDVFRDLTYR